MTFEQMVIEMKARGFTHMGARCEQYLNDAYLLDICEEEDWPFLEATKSGTTPLEITDLRTIEYVVDDTQVEKLHPLVQARITDDWNPDLTEVGTPELYYVTEGKKVNVFPTSTTDEITVTYWKVPTELSGTEEPLLPTRYHSLIVDGAVARAYENSDDYELANVAKGRFDSRLNAMRDSLMNMQHDAPDDYVVVSDPGAMR